MISAQLIHVSAARRSGLSGDKIKVSRDENLSNEGLQGRGRFTPARQLAGRGFEIFLPGHSGRWTRPQCSSYSGAEERSSFGFGADGVTRMSGLLFQRPVAGINHTYRTMRQLRSDVTIDDFVFRNLRQCSVTHLADVGSG